MSGQVPSGVEVLVKKAAVDSDFKAALLEQRAEAGAKIGLHLEPPEVTMLVAVPRDQLEAMIEHVTVPAEHRAIFLGHDVQAMLAVAARMPPTLPMSDGSASDERGQWRRRAQWQETSPGRIACRGTRPDLPSAIGRVFRWVGRWLRKPSVAPEEQAQPSVTPQEQCPSPPDPSHDHILHTLGIRPDRP